MPRCRLTSGRFSSPRIPPVRQKATPGTATTTRPRSPTTEATPGTTPTTPTAMCSPAPIPTRIQPDTYNAHNRLLTSTTALAHDHDRLRCLRQPTSVTDALSTRQHDLHRARASGHRDRQPQPRDLDDLRHRWQLHACHDANSNTVSATSMIRASLDGDRSVVAHHDLDAGRLEPGDESRDACGHDYACYDAEDHVTSTTDDTATRLPDLRRRRPALVTTKPTGMPSPTPTTRQASWDCSPRQTDGNSHTTTYSTRPQPEVSVSYPTAPRRVGPTTPTERLPATPTAGATRPTTPRPCRPADGHRLPHDTDVSLTYDVASRKTGMTDGSARQAGPMTTPTAALRSPSPTAPSPTATTTPQAHQHEHQRNGHLELRLRRAIA